uniref:Uncharacterized protein n=1 Tax=Anopheles epiroticus TaxID=199890 RepID=A0A182PVM3_9DIPT
MELVCKGLIPLLLLQLLLYLAVVSTFGVETTSQLPSIYLKYLRTRTPSKSNVLHVEEVLEVFRTERKPSRYGVTNALVNHFLANEMLRAIGQTTSTTTTTTVAPANRQPSTIRAPVYDTNNPSYKYLYSPSITATKYSGYPSKSVIIIKEADQLMTSKASAEEATMR